VSFGVLLTVGAVIFLAELPDKSMFASLVLGTRYRPLYVWLGVASAFLVHVIIAVSAGSLLHLLPHRLVQAVVALLFLAGAALVLFSVEEDEKEAEEAEENAEQGAIPARFWRVFLTSFTVIFLGEWGDITQIATANYAAKYDPLTVAVGATLGLWLVSALGVTIGSKLLRYVNVRLLQRITAAILVVFAIISAISAIRG
jgi:Ca2+/H+ antiporter, TMEM165/GDT1 family